LKLRYLFNYFFVSICVLNARIVVAHAPALAASRRNVILLRNCKLRLR